ncbi:tripartite motif-containing protein 16-like [Cheilinus undulatus]|uniref:tripartite motif-containing protein 16-like n=1 Tax=Cheilinus undulatus TaxID=241271 RepID=UPI001BD251A8|nr:tripartite motif-containing protein 16-like [Cheilinus undulatus]
MMQKGFQLERETVCCSICLDLLRDPVTVPCGHNYCMSCIKTHWDTEDERGIYRCPQCMQLFTPRPVLVKNTMLAVIVEGVKKTGFQDVLADHCFAGPEDVACDVCTGRKLKACKSCLFCVISFCEEHLQPHYDSPAFSKHELVEPSRKLHEYVCLHHNEVMKMFCRTDQRSICGHCLMDDHKGHDTVSAAAERAERQKELKVSRRKIQQRIQDREKDAKLLQEEVEAINRSADKALDDSDKISNELMLLMERRRTEVKQEVRSQQDTEVRRVKELEQKLEEEIAELKRKDTELEKLFLTKDHNHFLHDYPSLSRLGESTDSYSINIRPVSYFEDVAAAVKEVGDRLRDILSEKWTKVSQSVTEVDASLSQPEPKTRAEFLQHACDITIDPNTANTFLLLSNGNRKATVMSKQQSYCGHPDRFTGWCQVLSEETLRGRCYWEVEWKGEGVCVTVAYRSIMRGGRSNECRFGNNEKSWALDCYNNSYNFWFNNIKTYVSGPRSSKVGVYLDYDAGALSFYNISETMTLLHRVHTTFTEPLHAGLRFYYVEVSAGFCELKQTDKLEF